MSELVTRVDLDKALDQAVTTLRGEIAATRVDLDQAMTKLHSEMGAMEDRLRGETGAMEKRLCGETGAMEKRLCGETGAMEKRLRGELGAMEDRLAQRIEDEAKKVANVMVEHLSGLVSVVDDKYKDLPKRHEKLRSDLDGHVADLRLHRPAPPTPAKRARRS